MVILPQSDDRTDIQVETLNDLGDRLTVIIEVKCCWYKEIYAALQRRVSRQILGKPSALLTSRSLLSVILLQTNRIPATAETQRVLDETKMTF